jgi:phosphoglycerate dehydrogenase-like enzyme
MTESPVRVAVLDDYQQVALASADWSPLEGRAEVDVFADHLDDDDALAHRLQPYDVVVVMRERTPFPRSLIERLPRLRLLVTTAQRNASIDTVAAAEHGVVVSGTSMVATGTPELTWALVLAAHRHLERELSNVRSGGWQTTVGTELAGRTIGLLGLGRIGSRVARYARAFDMTVLAWSQNLTDEAAAEQGAERVGRDELFARSDVVSIHLRLSERSRGLVGAEQLSLLGRDGWLVNTSRGPIVDEAALVDALDSGRIAGVALDVFDDEPLSADHPLRSHPHAVLTPHIGYVTRQNYAVFFSGVVEDVVAWLDGEPVRVLPAG